MRQHRKQSKKTARSGATAPQTLQATDGGKSVVQVLSEQSGNVGAQLCRVGACGLRPIYSLAVDNSESESVSQAPDGASASERLTQKRHSRANKASPPPFRRWCGIQQSLFHLAPSSCQTACFCHARRRPVMSWPSHSAHVSPNLRPSCVVYEDIPPQWITGI